MKYSKKHTVYLNSAGIEVPSVTTVLKILNKPFLTKWANIMGFKRRNVDDILDETSRIGTMVHGVIRSFLMGYYYIWMGDPWDRDIVVRRLDSFITWKKNYEIEPIFMEKELISDRIAGTCDFYGMIDSKCTIMDFKASKKFYSSMFLQLAAYCIMLEAQGLKVEQVCIVLVNDTGASSKFIQRGDLDPYIDSFNKLLDLFHSWFDLNEEHGWGSIL
jgi:hypothetical protein